MITKANDKRILWWMFGKIDRRDISEIEISVRYLSH